MKHKISVELAEKILDRSGGSCENCGGFGSEIHHVVRRSVEPTEDNLILLCTNCYRGTYGVHGMKGHELDVKLKKNLQDKLFAKGLSESEVRKLMGGKIEVEWW